MELLTLYNNSITKSSRNRFEEWKFPIFLHFLRIPHMCVCVCCVGETKFFFVTSTRVSFIIIMNELIFCMYLKNTKEKNNERDENFPGKFLLLENVCRCESLLLLENGKFLSSGNFSLSQFSTQTALIVVQYENISCEIILSDSLFSPFSSFAFDAAVVFTSV